MSVNPWSLQKELMEISDQEIRESPAITKTSILYLALELEEMGEKCNTLHAILKTCRAGAAFEDIAALNAAARNFLAMTSAALRERVAMLPQEFFLPLTKQQAVDLADDTTDVAVVNCGFAAAIGIPGDKCYDEVVRSNLSKANPVTGKIDKTPDGKWIKGPNFFKPNLEAVIFGPPRPPGLFDNACL